MSVDALQHRVPLTDGWTVWSWVWVRGAGFPAELALRLATEKSAAIAARLAEVEAAEEEARRAAVAACEAALTGARGAESGALARALKQLRAGREVDARGLPEEASSAAARLAEQSRLRAELRGELGTELTAESTAAMAHMQELVRRGPMREALVWQNRRLVRGTVDAFLRRPPERDDSKMREYGRVLATYVQRYCVRNDTIGFFGPVGWARFTDAGDAVVARPAEELVAERKVFFEHWAVDALAGRLAADPSLRVHLAPRRTPSVRLDGPVLRYGIGRSAELPAVFVRVMDACDGEASAAVVAARVLCEPIDSLSGVAEVMDVIEELAAVQLVTWTLELPTGQPYPERTLRGLLKRVRAPAARGPAMAALEQLEGARDAVARAAGDASRLEGAMDSLDATFTELTGAEPTRRAGQSHAGRGIVYEDCRRAGEIELGAPLRARLAGPLSLVLASARWFTYEIGRRYRALFGQVHAELSAELGHSRIELTRFKDRIDPHLAASGGEVPAIVRDVAAELCARWMGILAPGDRREVRRTCAELRGPVAEAFRAPHPGWPNARYHSPDLLIAADGLDGLARGDYQIVVGEIHTGINTLLTQVALEQHPARDDLVRARELDGPEPGIAPVEAAEHASRADNCPVARHDFHLEIGATRSWRPRDQVLAIADLFTAQEGGRLVVSSFDGRHEFDVVAFFEQDLTFACNKQFRLVAGGAHTPRVVIDDLVVAREQWRFEPDALEFARRATPLDRLIGAQAWRQRHGLPRWVFVTVPHEPKPLYVDLSSSIYVEILARWARQAASVGVSEMLPEHGQTWLSDAAGRRYTSELRIAAVDPEPWRPS
jgi:hypothetical protein